MGEVIPLRRPLGAIEMIRTARCALTAFLRPESGISRAQCVATIADLFMRAPIAGGPHQATEIIRKGREIIISNALPGSKLDMLFELLESAEAVADPRLIELVFID